MASVCKPVRVSGFILRDEKVLGGAGGGGMVFANCLQHPSQPTCIIL